MIVTRIVAGSGLALAVITSSLATPQVAAATTPYDVRIQVLDPAGQAVGAGVSVYDDTATHTGRTNARGRVTFTGVDSTGPSPRICTQLDLTSQHLAGPTGWVRACADVTPPASGAVAVTLRFTVGAALGGTLVDRRTGRPAVGVFVDSIGGGDSFAAGRSDESGRFVVPNLTPGGVSTGHLDTETYGTAPDAPYGWAHEQVAPPGYDLRAGRITPIGRHQVSPLVRYDVRVITRDGTPVEGGDVRVADVDGDPGTPPDDSPVVQTYDHGVHRLFTTWTAAPNRRLCADVQFPSPEHVGGLALRCVADHDRSLTVATTIALVDGGCVTGAVADPDKQAYEVDVRVLLGGEYFAIRAVVGSTRNTYTTCGVPNGAATVVATPFDDRYVASASPTVTVRPNTVTTAPRITLSPAGS